MIKMTNRSFTDSQSTVINPKKAKLPLALIVTQARGEFKLDQIYEALRRINHDARTLADYNGAGKRPRVFYPQNVEDIDDVEILVAGRDVSIRDMLHVMPNLRTVYTTNPSYKNTKAMVNGRPNVVKVLYIDPRSPISNSHATQLILGYLSAMNSSNTANTSDYASRLSH